MNPNNVVGHLGSQLLSGDQEELSLELGATRISRRRSFRILLIPVLLMILPTAVWAECPLGTRNNYKGECIPQGVKIVDGRFQPPLYTLLTNTDAVIANQALDKALETLPSQKVLNWSNPETGHAGALSPVKTYYVEKEKTYCRHYREVVIIGNASELYRDVACRTNDGHWIPVE